VRAPERNDFFVDDWLVTPSKGLLTRGEEISRLEPKAMEVLVYMASRPNEVITRDELERDVWRGAQVGYDAVTNTIIKLRKALGDDSREPRFIATLPKLGYQLIAPITTVEENASGAEGQFFAKMFGRIRALAWWPTFLGIAGVFLATWLWTMTDREDLAPPSILVLPFEHLGNDAKQEYLAASPLKKTDPLSLR
jgi:DNA-binding winged helix-turn-helix (wHTH) protein